jgi:hypothetical protein
MIIEQRKRQTIIGAIFPHSPGSRERGSAKSAEMSRAITKPTMTRGKT